MRVAYLVSGFPKVSETFIVDEILELRRTGVDVDLYALARVRDRVAHPEAAALAEDCHVDSVASPAVLAAQLVWALRAPRTWAGLWWRVARAHLRAPRAWLRTGAAVALAARYALLLERRGLTHLHAHWATHPALAAWVIHRLTGLSYSFTGHADDLFVRQNLLTEKAEAASFVVTVSDYNRRFLEQLAPGARVEVVHCGVRSAALEARGATQLPADGLRIVCVARLEEKKGHAVLIDACAELARRGVDFDCRLIGEGSLRPALERRLAAAGLAERVRILGALPHEQVLEHVREADVACLPSVVSASGRRDGIPVALMEAMALGIPVVAGRVSGVPELVEAGETGLLVEHGVADGLADALADLAGDPTLRRRLGEAGQRRVRDEFDLERNVARLRGLLEGAAGRSEPATAPPPLAARPGEVSG